MALYNYLGVEISNDSPIMTGELPILFINSDTTYTNLTKSTSVEGTFTLIDGEVKINAQPIKFKLQGSGSLNYDKKNLNITFYVDNTYQNKRSFVFNHWYATNKIHLKANEYDYSMCRNSVGTRLAYGFLGKKLPSGAMGYIDSFPVVMYYNGVYMGCHTVNLPQDGRTYNFTNEKEVSAENMAFRCKSFTSISNPTDWEYRGDLDELEVHRTAFNNLHAIMMNPNTLTKDIVKAHFDEETLIGYLVFAQIGLCSDSLTNNLTLITWDGSIWYHGYYDLDICFGIGGADGVTLDSTMDVFNTAQGKSNTFFLKVIELYETEFAKMYATFRKNGADTKTIMNKFVEFQQKWGWQNIKADRNKWGYDKLTSVDVSDIEQWLDERFAFLDEKYSYNEEE